MNWYEEEIQYLEACKNKLTFDPQIIFYGSSSIRLWTTLYDDFVAYLPLNLGFGGSTLDACTWFFERMLLPYHPAHLVLYAGDNDLGDGRNPDEVCLFFCRFVEKFRQSFPHTSLTYISVKPSPARWPINGQIMQTNKLIAGKIAELGTPYYFLNVYDLMVENNGTPKPELYEADGLHMNANGYAIWKELTLNHFRENLKIR
ncbi:hypothetical protein DYBT9275_03242 [Dyadobacter sp. CECT 9275]|uniref:SGNH hydrolase-type esterase domain-containing protein n=1 Tax=Dyadobacter helix TaxID=2822344 RepID=A0A916JDL7_9BACT|nr:GDSL-type esterase/lipase family protein [Dyadobacter sp. CECT 9275]CAG5003850.1 hypothetical protein DYBT9275_03242 [Dyadobacter sp. CECT 9275]